MNCPGSRCPCVDVPQFQLPMGIVMMIAAVCVVIAGMQYATRRGFPPETLFLFWIAGALFLYGFAFAITRIFCT